MTGRISPTGLYAASGILFSVAILCAIVRTVARWRRFRRFSIDDIFLFVAVTTLIAGTVLLYINIPLAWDIERITFGEVLPSTDFVDVVVTDERTQFASTTLIGTSIICVKFSFLGFFYSLSRLTKRWHQIWWGVVVVLTLASAPVLMFSDFIACPYTGADIITNCNTPAALARENAAVRASVALDIISDVSIISIPVLILWDTYMDIRRKLLLSGSLCMGVFMIVCACVRLGTANLDGEQIDVLWVLFWQHIEACVAVIVVSMASCRMLFQTGSALTKSLEGPSIGKPTRRDRYESEGWSHPSHLFDGMSGLGRKESEETADGRTQRPGGQPMGSRELSLFDKEPGLEKGAQAS